MKFPPILHPSLDRIRKAIKDTPYEHSLWLVGGCVRDHLLGRPAKTDFDMVYEGNVEDLTKWLAPRLGVAPPNVYPRFGTAMLRIDSTDFEFASARKESYADGPRKPVVSSATLVDDALRRDFTVNAFMQNLSSSEIINHLVSGFEDLENRILRTPLDPVKTFEDDPLRILRAIRFKTQLEFKLAPELADALRSEAGELEKISAERQQQEFNKILSDQNRIKGLETLREFGILDVILPELVAMVGVEQGKYHDLDVWGHTLEVIRQADSSDLVLNLACLFHDVGKPETRFVDEKGDIRFFGHETVGAEIATRVLRRLRYGADIIDSVNHLVKNHMRLGSSLKFSASAARRLVRDMGDELERLLDLVDADSNALARNVKKIDIGAIRAQIAQVLEVTPPDTLQSPLTGYEVMALLKIEPGRRVGEVQRFLTEMVLEGTLDPHDKALARQAALGFVGGHETELSAEQ